MKKIIQASPAVLHCGKTIRNCTHLPYVISSESCNIFIYVLSGNGIHEVNGCRRVLSTGTLEIIPPYMHQVIENYSDEPLEIIYIYFDLFETETEVSHKDKNRPLSSNEMYFADKCCYKIAQKHRSRIAELCLQILKAGASEILLYRLFQKQRMLELIALFLDEQEIAEGGTVMPQNDYVFRAMQYIEANYGDASLCAKSTAQYLGITTDYLSRLFKAQAHITLSDYIRSLRISRAKELFYIDTSIASVAEKCGFSSVQSFCRTFKNLENVTPGNYINQSNQTISFLFFIISSLNIAIQHSEYLKVVQYSLRQRLRLFLSVKVCLKRQESVGIEGSAAKASQKIPVPTALW